MKTNYSNAGEHLAESLSLALDRERLRHLLVDELAPAIRSSGVALLLKDHENTLTLVGAGGLLGSLAHGELPGDGELAMLLGAMARPLRDDRVRSALVDAPLCEAERALLSLANIAYWLPLVSDSALQGLVLIGPRPGEDSFTSDDERILAALAREAGLAAHNVWLAEQVRAGREELARAHQQLLMGYEKEQRRWAQEVHDSAVQQLLGISYQLADLRQRTKNKRLDCAPCLNELSATLGAVQQEVSGVVVELRHLIRELSPAGLEELGLTDALEGYMAHLEREGASDVPEIELHLDRSGTALAKPVAVCLFRVAQEAVRNALKHARARHIKLDLRVVPREAVLCVRDDGCGFCVPTRLSAFTQNNHFGLFGMAERVGWAGGHLTIGSQLGTGTEVIARVPLDEARP